MGHFAVYDQLELNVTILSALAGYVLSSGGEQVEDLATDLAAESDESVDKAREAVTITIETLMGVGLIGRDSKWEPPPAVSGSTLERDPGVAVYTGAVQSVFDQRLAFRSSDQPLLNEIQTWLGIEAIDDASSAPTVYFDAEPTASGGVDLTAAEHWGFPDKGGFMVQLPGVINDFAGRLGDMLVLHAGSVRGPDGSVTVLPGIPEAGKSTLTAALIQAGFDYLGDELVGVRSDSLQAVGFPRALALDEISRVVLALGAEWESPYVHVRHVRSDAVAVAGDSGTVERIVLPTFDPNAAAPSLERIDSARDVLEALLGTAMNLPWVQEPGWVTLCQLAEQVPAYRLRYPDAVAAANVLN